MTNYELLSIFASLIACCISLNNWFGQRKLQQESNDLQRATSELAKKQLDIILSKEEKDVNRSHIALSLIRDGSMHRFKITNVSNVVATNVNMELILKNHNDNPISSGEYKDKLPIKMLPPGGSITLIAAFTFSTPTSYNAVLKWTNPDGSLIEEETFVSL